MNLITTLLGVSGEGPFTGRATASLRHADVCALPRRKGRRAVTVDG